MGNILIFILFVSFTYCSESDRLTENTYLFSSSGCLDSHNVSVKPEK